MIFDTFGMSDYDSLTLEELKKKGDRILADFYPHKRIPTREEIDAQADHLLKEIKLASQRLPCCQHQYSYDDWKSSYTCYHCGKPM